MANFIAVTKTQAWKELDSIHSDQSTQASSDSMFKEFGAWSLDLSRSGLNQGNLKKLIKACDECDLTGQIKRAFLGEEINFTEKRAVLHMSLRDLADDRITPSSAQSLAATELERLSNFAQKIRAGKIKDVVNIGIGGSDLGPKLLTESLRPYASGPNIHYVSNVDPAHLKQTLKSLDPASTLFVIVSKTFTTQETMNNAIAAKAWGGGKARFCAVTTAVELAREFGIEAQDCFKFWDWVGGRFSMWSAVGLSSMIALGPEIFKRVLSGAHDMDRHFLTAPIAQNLPVHLALWDIWNVNQRGFASVALLPYEQNLESFPRWFQQLAMESNGKSVDRLGEYVDYSTCPTYWGEVGTNGQHAFYQLLHQGTEMTPCEFIGFARSNYQDQKSHQLLLANMLAQSKAFYEGSKGEDRYRNFKGQRPNIILLADQATPERLGELFALYEHRVMAQGFLWNIPSFDQWGVELGKKLTKDILEAWETPQKLDGITSKLVTKIRTLS